jgi:hypothetical protein
MISRDADSAKNRVVTHNLSNVTSYETSAYSKEIIQNNKSKTSVFERNKIDIFRTWKSYWGPNCGQYVQYVSQFYDKKENIYIRDF